MEKIPTRNSSELVKNKREHLRNEIFQQLVAGKVLMKFHEELEDTDLLDNDIQEISDTFQSLSEENKRVVLAIPAQLRKGVFEKYAKQVIDGKMSASEVVFDMLDKSLRHGFTLGFHLSPQEIKPDKNGAWVVRGSEKDHRHNDLPMAYYSNDYAHRYLKKPVQWLYVIRAETGDDSGHYRDNNGAWGHASTLSIVDAIDLQKLESDMDNQIKDMESKTKGETP